MLITLDFNGISCIGRLDLSKAAKIKNPGSRGGKYYIDDHGNIIYGERNLGRQAGLFDEPEKQVEKQKPEPEKPTPIKQAAEKVVAAVEKQKTQGEEPENAEKKKYSEQVEIKRYGNSGIALKSPDGQSSYINLARSKVPGESAILFEIDRMYQNFVTKNENKKYSEKMGVDDISNLPSDDQHESVLHGNNLPKMTEYIDKYRKYLDTAKNDNKKSYVELKLKQIDNARKILVKNRIAVGKTVSPEIVAEYPDLQLSKKPKTPAVESKKISEEDAFYNMTDSEMLDFLNNKYSEYGGKNKYLSSNEYKKILPFLKKRDERRMSEYVQEADKALMNAGLKYGDKVDYVVQHGFGMGEVYVGTLINKKGVPHVKTTEHGRSKTVRWNRGWQKVVSKPKSVVEKQDSPVSPSSDKVTEAMSEYGWTVEKTGKESFNLKNRKGAPVAVVTGTDKKYKITDMAGNKLLTGNNGMAAGAEKVAKEYFYAQKVAR